jgi:hypothetical protein
MPIDGKLTKEALQKALDAMGELGFDGLRIDVLHVGVAGAVGLRLNFCQGGVPMVYIDTPLMNQGESFVTYGVNSTLDMSLGDAP